MTFYFFLFTFFYYFFLLLPYHIPYHTRQRLQVASPVARWYRRRRAHERTSRFRCRTRLRANACKLGKLSCNECFCDHDFDNDFMTTFLCTHEFGNHCMTTPQLHDHLFQVPRFLQRVLDHLFDQSGFLQPLENDHSETTPQRLLLYSLAIRAEGLRVGSTARVHSEDDDASNRMSVPLRQQLCAFCQGSSRADRLLRGAHGGRVHPGTVISHSRSRK